MTDTCRDHDGRNWKIKWGVDEPVQTLLEVFNCVGPLLSTTDLATFDDPRYPREMKTFQVYTCPSGQIVAMAEITPGVYAVGIQI